MVQYRSDWFRKFCRSTSEKEDIGIAIERLLGGQKGTAIDIGLGEEPKLAEILAPSFQEYTIVEQRSVGNAQLPPNATIVNADWMEYQTAPVDAVIASHVVYYFPDMKAGIQKIEQSIAEGGRGYIVVNAKDGSYGALKNEFAALTGMQYEFTVDRVKRNLSLPWSVEKVNAAIVCPSQEELLDAMQIWFDNHPREYQQHRGEMKRFLGGTFPENSIHYEQEIIILEK